MLIALEPHGCFVGEEPFFGDFLWLRKESHSPKAKALLPGISSEEFWATRRSLRDMPSIESKSVSTASRPGSFLLMSVKRSEPRKNAFPDEAKSQASSLRAFSDAPFMARSENGARPAHRFAGVLVSQSPEFFKRW